VRGTHVGATGEIGVYLTTQEASVGTNVRRIEALTGMGAESHLRQRNDLIASVASRLQTTPEQVADRIEGLQEELAEMRRQVRKLQGAQGREEADRLAANARQVAGIPVVSAIVTVPDERTLREMGDAVRSRLGSGVIVLATELDGQARFIVTVDSELVKREVSANIIARTLGERLGGRGGGRNDSAQGGSKDTTALQSALAAIADILQEQVA